MSKTLKPEQKTAIEFENSVLLPANAGSGKTFVMLQRVLYAIKHKNASILDFLLITFTESAAGQMKSKLQKELLKAYKAETDAKTKLHLKNQINLISVADISTIDAFCSKIVKKYFYALGVEANINICDDGLKNTLKERAFKTTLNNFCKNENQDFFTLVADYDNKRNFSILKKIIVKLQEFFENEPNKDELRQKMLDVYQQNSNPIFETLKDWALLCFDYYAKIFEDYKKEAQFLKAKNTENTCTEILKFLKMFDKNSSLKQIHQAVFNVKFSAMKSDKNPDAQELYENVKKTKGDDLKKDLDKLKELFVFEDFEKVNADLLWCENNVKMILEMQKEFEEHYQKQKKQKNVLDFADLECFALKILRQPNLAKEISKLYEQIFVDEYQDVNDIQEEIINLLWENGNNVLFLVGDPKQSIYGFRHTNPQIMLNKLQTFTQDSNSTRSIPLLYNFRSNKSVLEFSNFLFSKLMTTQNSKLDYKSEGQFLVGLEDFPENPNFPSVEIDIVNKTQEKEEKLDESKVYSVKNDEICFKNDLLPAHSEASIIASKLAEMFKENYQIFDVEQGVKRDLNYNDIAILYRSRGPYINAVISELENYGIPVKKVSAEKILGESEVQVLINFLKLLNNTDDDYVLTGFLTGMAVDMDIEDLLSLKKDENLSFAQNVLQSNHPKVLFAKSLIEEGRKELLNNSIFHVLNWFLEKTNYKSKLLSYPNGQSKVLNAMVFVDDLESKNYGGDLVSYLSYLEENDDFKVEIKNGGEQNAISVMTMHQSKGLEFPVVFVINMSHQFNMKDLIQPCLFSEKLGLGVERFDKTERFKNETIARSAIVVEQKQKLYAEELRLLYVALTRAKNHLFMLGTSTLKNLKSVQSDFAIYKSSNYFDLILSTLDQSALNSLMDGKENLKICTNKEKNTFVMVNVFPLAENPSYVLQSKEQDSKFLELSDIILQNAQKNQQILEEEYKQSGIALKNSVSRLMEKEDNRENISHTFKKFEISENMASPDKVGTAFHSAMEVVPFDLSSEQEVRDFLEKNMEHEQFLLIDTQKIFKCLQNLKPLLDGATKILREAKFYLYEKHNKLVPNGTDDKILIQGIVDLVICKKDGAILIDYKTNHEKNDENLIKKYQIQLDCYKIAIENALKIKVNCKILYSFFKDYAIFV